MLKTLYDNYINLTIYENKPKENSHIIEELNDIAALSACDIMKCYYIYENSEDD